MASDTNARKSDHSQSGVYTITCKPTGKAYCGSSSRVRKRYMFHIWQLKKGIHANKQLQADFDRYGETAFEFAIVALEVDRYKRDRLEWTHIAELKSHDRSYNIRHFSDYSLSAKTQVPQRREERPLLPDYRMPYFLMHF